MVFLPLPHFTFTQSHLSDLYDGSFRLDTMPSSPAFALRRRGEKDRRQNLTEVFSISQKNDLRPCVTETIMWSQRLPHLMLIALPAS